MSHYIAAITLYPPLSAGVEHPFEFRRNWFLWVFSAAAVMDIVQTAARGALFMPWYYLPFVLHYVVVALLAIFVNKPGMHRAVAWYLLLVTASWSFVVRRFLVD